jgi:hypothetical protein
MVGENLNDTNDSPKYSFVLKLLFYLIPMALGLIYWLAFFPGVMTYDSVSQWAQLSTFKFTNWHPAFHTILMWILTRIWYSPAIISLFQVVIASLVIGYGLNSIRKVIQLPGYIFIALGFLISANPLVGIIDVTLWKDVLYGFFVLLLSISIFNVVSSDGEWIVKPKHFILFGSALAFIWLFRPNGFPIVVASLIAIVIIYKKHFKQFIFSSLITISIILFVIGPVYTWFKVDRETKQSYGYGVVFIHPVVAYVNSNSDLGYLSDNEKQYLNKIYPLNETWSYSCYDATVFFYKNTFLDPVIRDPLMMVKIFARLAIKDPKIMINHYLCLSSFVWSPFQPRNVYLETILFDNYNLNQTPSWKIYADEVNQHSILPQVRGFIRHIVEAEWNRDIYRILWRPAIYMYLFLASLAFFVYRTSNKKWLLLSVPLITQSVVIMFTAQLEALRYQFPVYLISMLFTIPLIVMGQNKHHQVTKNKLTQLQES